MKSRILSCLVGLALSITAAACGETDAGITTAVKGKLAADNDVKAYQIDVDTKDKVVTLTGTVDTATAETRALEIARGTDGVSNVVDNVTVSPVVAAPSLPAPDIGRAAFSDTEITGSVKTKLLADDMVKGLRIDVDTRDGVVTLTGEVKSQAEKDQALKLARETEGVKSVTDRMTVVR